MKLELVTFDVAGTTVAAAEDVARVFAETFETHRLPLSTEAIASVRGRSKKDAIRELVGHRADPDEVYSNFKERLVRASPQWRPIPGAIETFEWLRARDIRTALTTGFDRDVLDTLLGGLGWLDGRVDAAVSAEDVPNGRPAPDLILRSMELCGVGDPLAVAAVGDTTADLLAAANAGVGWAIGVLSGAHTADQLAECPHTAILGSVADLGDWYRRLE